jgi:hypothetical protein
MLAEKFLVNIFLLLVYITRLRDGFGQFSAAKQSVL